jgi:arsenate reductase-like glutaredoxin family protein
MDFADSAEEIIYCNEEYQALSETFMAQVTFQQFVSIKNTRWSKDEVTQWVKRMEEINYWFNIAKENKAKEGKEVDASLSASRWKEA